MTCFFDGVPIYVGRIRYAPSYWDDLRVPATATTAGGANDPSFLQFANNGAGSTGIYNWRFSHLVSQELFFNAQFPHAWRESTDVHPHVHWCPDDNTAGNVEWGIEYSIATINGTFPNTTITTVSDAAGGVAKKHQYVDFPVISMSGNLISTMLSGRIYRNAPADTYNAGAWLLEIDFHIEIDSPGSRSEHIK